MANIAKVVGFHKIDESDIGKLLGSHTHKLAGRDGPIKN